jgi:hypothetical protein
VAAAHRVIEHIVTRKSINATLHKLMELITFK